MALVEQKMTLDLVERVKPALANTSTENPVLSWILLPAALLSPCHRSFFTAQVLWRSVSCCVVLRSFTFPSLTLPRQLPAEYLAELDIAS
jgi:hypothetical protein